MPPKLTGKTLSRQQRTVLAGRLSGKSFSQIAREEGKHRSTTLKLFKRLEPFLSPNVRARLSEAAAATKLSGGDELVRLRLGGNSFAKIAAQVKLSRRTVSRRLRQVARTLDPQVAAKLALANIGGTYQTTRGAANREKVTRVFLEEIDRYPHPFLILKRTAQRTGLENNVLFHHLRRAGINWRAELHRRHIAFALRVAESMHLPQEEAAHKLQVTRRTINNYRTRVQRGEHLQGALELVENPEAQQWWDLTMPEVSDSLSSGPAKLNLTVRNQTVQRDLELLEQARVVAKQEAFQHHPDKPENRNAVAEAKFRNVTKQITRLKQAVASYRERELKFREKYRLPIPVFLKK